jgi:hypothetical protein
MGALTCDRHGKLFGAPASELDWMWHRHENWLDDLWGTHEPIGVLFPYDELSSEPFAISGVEVDTLANTVRCVPSIAYLGFASTEMISAADADRLRSMLPRVTVERGTPTRRAAKDAP